MPDPHRTERRRRAPRVFHLPQRIADRRFPRAVVAARPTFGHARRHGPSRWQWPDRVARRAARPRSRQSTGDHRGAIAHASSYGGTSILFSRVAADGGARHGAAVAHGLGPAARARMDAARGWRISSSPSPLRQPRSGLRRRSDGNREKSRSVVHSSPTPWRRQMAATRASWTRGPSTRASATSARSVVQ